MKPCDFIEIKNSKIYFFSDSLSSFLTSTDFLYFRSRNMSKKYKLNPTKYNEMHMDSALSETVGTNQPVVLILLT